MCDGLHNVIRSEGLGDTSRRISRSAVMSREEKFSLHFGKVHKSTHDSA